MDFVERLAMVVLVLVIVVIVVVILVIILVVVMVDGVLMIAVQLLAKVPVRFWCSTVVKCDTVVFTLYLPPSLSIFS